MPWYHSCHGISIVFFSNCICIWCFVLHNKVAVMTSKLWNITCVLSASWKLRFQAPWAARATVFSSYMTKILNSLISIIFFFVANVALLGFLKIIFISLGHFQWLVEFQLNYNITTLFDLFQHSLHKLVNRFFTSIWLYLFGVLIIIATNYFITKSTICLFLIRFGLQDCTYSVMASKLE